ncbi:MAG: Hsp70 family protein [Anaeroplasma sp.]
MKEITVGIDLGTTYSVVATYDSKTGKVIILKNGIGEDTTPSVVCIEDGVETIGQPAKDMQGSGNINCAAFYKSMMADENYSAYLDGNSYSAEDLSEIFLRNLKKEIENTNDVVIKSAVITCPAYFNEKQRKATENAGKRAGFDVLMLINEPTAAIIAYGLTGQGKRNVMVYDLGGGTFDVTVAKIDGASVIPLATNGDHKLGGRDWDRVLIDNIVERFNDEFGIDITEYSDDYNELIVKCEKAKKLLTNMSQTLISVSCQGYNGRYTVTKEFFDEMTETLRTQTMDLVDTTFNEINMSWRSIDEVVLVGGSTRMPQISEMVEKELGKKPRIIGNKVDTIVAAGASMQAYLCTYGQISLNPIALGMAQFDSDGKKQNLTSFTLSADSIKDITSHSLGMLVFDSEKLDANIVNSIILKKNSIVGVPCGKNYVFSGEKMEVYVLQGESEDPYESTLLYKFIVSGMNNEKDITVNFLYNKSGIVEVTSNTAGGKQLNVKQEVISESIEDVINRLKDERKESMKPQGIHVTFLIDTSGSMDGSGIDAARNAMYGFVNQLSFPNSYVSIINFANSSSYDAQSVNNLNSIKKAIGAISVGKNGYGTSADPFDYYLRNSKSKGDLMEIIIALTDGEWFNQNEAITSANKVKNKNITIYAVGVADADYSFLKKIASPGCAQKVDLSQLTSAFKSISSSIASIK